MASARSLRLWLSLRIALAGILSMALAGALVLGVVLPQLRADLEIPYEALAHAIVGQMWVLVVGALMAFTLALAVALGLARGLARRIRRHADQAHAIAEGDYDQPWPVSGLREFGGLGEDLERMSLAIGERERDLAASEARYRSVISNAPVVMFQFDEHGVFTLSEGKGLTRVGLRPGQAVGQSLFDLYPDYPDVCEFARRAIGGEALQFVSRIGEAFFDTYFNPVRDDRGHIQVMGVAVDITERRRAEESFQESEARLRSAIESVPFDFFLIAPNGRYLLQNSACIRTWGDVVGKRPEDVADNAATLAHWNDNSRRAFAGEIVEEEVRHVVDDEERCIYNIIAPIKDRDEIKGIVGLNIDITERKHAEEALRRSNRQLRMLSDANLALMRITDEMELLNTVCTIAVQEGGYRMAWVGYAECDAPRSVRPVAHAGFEEGYLQCASIGRGDDECGLIGTAIGSGYPCLVQNIASDARFASRRAEAARRGYASMCALPLTVGDRTLGALGIYSSAPDAFDSEEIKLLSDLACDLAFGITALRTRIEHGRADAALRESEFFLRRSQEVGDLGSYYFDVRTGTWISSEKLDQIFGIDSAFQRTTSGWIDLVHPDDQEEMLQHMTEHVLAKHNKFDKEYRILRHNDRQERWVHGLGELEFDQSGVPIKMIGTIQDITRSKRAEVELQRHREHLEELVDERTAELRRAMTQLVQAEKLAGLGSLVAGIAHELNTPLGNARVVASSLGDHLREFSTIVESGTLRRSQLDAFMNRSREAVDLLERNAARAADLISHFKQVAVDQTSMRRRPFNFCQTVEEVLVTLQPQFNLTAHRIEREIPPDLELDSYPGPLEQIIANLISNSLTHGFDGVAAGVIRIRAESLGAGRIQIEYSDNGVGIPEAILKRIFEPFFTTRLGSGGSGLGLYIVYNLVTGLLGGTVEVDSALGRGVRFVIALPQVVPDQPSLETPP